MTSRVRLTDGLCFAVVLLVSGFAISAAPAAGATGTTSVEGKLQVAHSDDFAGKRTSYHYSLQTRGRSIALRLGSGKIAARLRKTPTGARVSLRGRRTGRALHVTSGRVTTSARVSATTSGTRKTAVVMIKFNDSVDPFTAAEAKQAVFTRMNTFYGEQSGGDVSFRGIDNPDGDVFGAYRVTEGTGCNYNSWKIDAKQQAEAEHGSLIGYNHVVYLFPTRSACNWGGMGSVGGVSPGSVWLNGYLDAYIVAHELGHNLGLHHANSYRCTQAGVRVSISDSCTSTEYGDPFDVMGSSDHHFHSAGKGRLASLGVFPAMQTLAVTAPGNYTLEPNAPGSTGAQAIRVYKSGTSTSALYYYLETRKANGLYDPINMYPSPFGGVTIRIAKQYNTSPEQSQLIDATPATTTFGDAKLMPGKTFSDPTANVSITNVSQTSGEVATVHIDTSQNVPPPPPPTNLRASATTQTVTLNWEGNPADVSYNVFRDGAKIHSGDNLRSYVDTSAQPGVTHQYWVTSVNDVGGESQPSNQVAGKLLGDGQPPPPGGAPVITFHSPTEGQGASLRFKIWATAADDQKVTRVELYIDGVRRASHTGYRIKRYWNVRSTRVAAGPHTLTVIAHDQDGHATVKSISVDVVK